MDISAPSASKTSEADEKGTASPSNGGSRDSLPKVGPSKESTVAQATAALTTAAALDSFDLSAYDPLQAHVLQIAASAGYPDSTSMPFSMSPAPEHPVSNGPVTAIPATASQQAAQPSLTMQLQARQQQILAGLTTASLTGHSSESARALPQQPQQFFFGGAGVAAAPAVPLPASSATQPLLQPLAPLSAATAALPTLAPGPVDTSSATTTNLPSANAFSVPSVVSASTTVASNNSAASSVAPAKAFLKDPKQTEDWSTMTAEQKRKYERNIREQQRSFQISQQIKELRSLLTESNIPFKPNKFSILVCTSDYIKQLQTRAIMLDAEHRKLIETIKLTGEMVNNGQTPPDVAESSSDGNVGNDAEMLLVKGLDYRLVFDQCSAALGVSSLDGRILDCNMELLTMFGCSRQVLLTKTLFDLVHGNEEVFQAMGGMLKKEVAASVGTKRKANEMEDGDVSKPPLYWSGLVSKKGDAKVYLNVSLTRNLEDEPKFFNFALTTS